MAGTSGQNGINNDGNAVLIRKPAGTGETQAVSLQAGTQYILDFNVADIIAAYRKGSDFIIRFKDGSSVVLENAAAIDGAEFVLANGAHVSLDSMLASMSMSLDAMGVVGETDLGSDADESKLESVANLRDEMSIDEIAVAVQDLLNAGNINEAEQLMAQYAVDIASLETAAGIDPSVLAAIEPAAGDAGGPAGSNGFGFQSSFGSSTINPINPAIGPIDVTQLIFTLPEPLEQQLPAPALASSSVSAPVVQSPEIVANDSEAPEDGSTFSDLTITPVIPTSSLEIVISNIQSGWNVLGPGVFNAAAGTYTITLAPGEAFVNPEFYPPADSDADMTGLVVSVTETNLGTGDVFTNTGTFDIVVDAIADTPNLAVTTSTVDENDPADINISTSPNDRDGSEEIIEVILSGVPTGFTLSAGTFDATTGNWTLLPTELTGLQITPPTGFFGTINLRAETVVREVNLSGNEPDLTNNEARATYDFPVTWNPTITGGVIDVNNGVADAILKEDGSVDVPVVASLNPANSGNETLKLTLSGLDLTLLQSFSASDFAGTSWTRVAGTPDNNASFEITLPAGTGYIGTFNFVSLPDADFDQTALRLTATATEPSNNATATDTVDFNVIGDAVVDTPTLIVNNLTGEEQTAVTFPITTNITDNDAGLGRPVTSEIIEKIEISGLPAGATLNVGSFAAGVWTLTPAQLSGLEINLGSAAVGTYTLSITTYAVDQNLSGSEDDFSDNRTSVTETITLTVTPDDIPEFDENPNGDAGAGIVDESGFLGINAPVGSDTVGGTITADFKGDGPGTYSVNNSFSFSGSVLTSNGNMLSQGEEVTVSQSGNGYVGAAGGRTVFTITLNGTTGQYEFRLLDQLDHADGSNPNDLVNLFFGVRATDNDTVNPDSDDSVIRIVVLDDAPVANDDINSFDSDVTNTTSGNVITGQNGGANAADNESYDEFTSGPANKITSITFGGTTVNLTNDTSFFRIDGQDGYLMIRSDGQYTYTLFNNAVATAGQYTDQFIYTLTDFDGDSDTATLTIIAADDDTPEFDEDPNGNAAVGAVDETDFDNAPIGSDTVSGTINADFGNDGPGTYGVNGTFTFGGSALTQNGNLLSQGEEVSVSQSGNGYIGTAGGRTVFTITLNGTTGQYEFRLLDQLDHADGSNPNDLVNLFFGVRATDNDTVNPDSDDSVIRIVVLDDAPVANDDINSFDSDVTNTTSGNVITGQNGGANAADNESYDEFTSGPANKITSITFGGTTVNLTNDTSFFRIDGQDGYLMIRSDGQYTYTLFNNAVATAGQYTDQFIYTLTDFDGDSDTATLTIIAADDDTPEFDEDPNGNAAVGAVDETDFDNAPIGSDTVSGTINADFGNDGPGTYGVNGTFTFGGSALTQNGNLLSQGEEVSVSQSGNGYIGTAGGRTVFTITLNPTTGQYEFVLEDVLDHANPNNPNDIINLYFGVRATDNDAVNPDSDDSRIRIQVRDDAPSATTLFGVVHEDVLDNSNTIALTRDMNMDFGEDGPGAITASNKFEAVYEVNGAPRDLYSGGNLVTVTQSGNNYIGTANGETVFSLVIDPATGRHTYFQFKALDHDQSGQGDSVIWLKFYVNITDYDGDSIEAIIGIDVTDGVPVANDDLNTFDSDATNMTSGNVITGQNGGNGAADDQSNDAFDTVIPNNKITSITFGGTTVNLTNDTSFFRIDGQDGYLMIRADGQYTYTLFNNAVATNGQYTDQFTYTLTDFDGDRDTATLTITATDDDIPEFNEDPNGNAATGNVDDGQITDIVNGSITADFGNDGPGTYCVKGAGGFSFTGTALSQNGNLLSQGQEVSVTASVNGNSYTGMAGGRTIFTLTLNETTGQWQFRLIDTLDHSNPNASNEAINLFFDVIAKDNDAGTPDTDQSHIKIVVRDDAPVANDDDNDFDANTSTTTSGNVITGQNGGNGAADNLSNDEFASGPANKITKITFGGTTINLTNDTSFFRIDGQDGYLMIRSDGQYTYTLFNNAVATNGHYTDQFTYTLTDSDGDSDTATLNISADEIINITQPTVDLKLNGSDDLVEFCVKEDTTGTLNVRADVADGTGNETLTITIQGIDPSWNVTLPNGWVNLGSGTYRITLNNTTSYDDDITFRAPANSDIDMSNVRVTATVNDPDTNSSDSDSDTFDVVGDAVADDFNVGYNYYNQGGTYVTQSIIANLDWQTESWGRNNNRLAITRDLSDVVAISQPADQDGSEEMLITLSFTALYHTGATSFPIAFDVGTLVSSSGNTYVWQFTYQEYQNATLTSGGHHYDQAGRYLLNVSVTNTETNLNGQECDHGDNQVTYSASGIINIGDHSRTPLVIDLDGDGLDLTSLYNAAVSFDLDGDGREEYTGWVQPDDAFLVMDWNGDGMINDGTELFGDATGYEDGFAALAALDENGDGVIDAQDSLFSLLQIWQDLNGNGISEAGELMTMDQIGITSLSLDVNDYVNMIEGNGVVGQTIVTFADGSTVDMYDVYFRTNEVPEGVTEINGTAANDIIGSTLGSDIMTGGEGADIFHLIQGADGTLDVITDFDASEGDRIDFSQMIQGYDNLQGMIDNFVFTTEVDGNTVISIDQSGSGDASNAVDVVILQGANDLTLDQIVQNAQGNV